MGKTCLIRRYKFQDAFSTPQSKITTLGIESQQVKLKINNMVIKVVLWDTAGQERFESMTKSFYQNLDGVLLVFDVTNHKSFASLNQWLG